MVRRSASGLLLAACLALPAAAQPAAAPAPSASFGHLPLARGDAAASAAWGWGQLAGGIALFAVLAGVLHAMRRRTGGTALATAPWWPGKAPAGGLQVLHAARLGPQVTLHVVHWGGDELLVACAPNAVTLLAQRPRVTPSGEPAA